MAHELKVMKNKFSLHVNKCHIKLVLKNFKQRFTSAMNPSNQLKLRDNTKYYDFQQKLIFINHVFMFFMFSMLPKWQHTLISI